VDPLPKTPRTKRRGLASARRGYLKSKPRKKSTTRMTTTVPNNPIPALFFRKLNVMLD